MGELTEEVRSLLNERFQGARIDLDDIPGGRLGGSVTWDGFADLPQSERQHQLWAALRVRLSAVHLRQLATFLTFTPQEVSEMEEVLAA